MTAATVRIPATVATSDGAGVIPAVTPKQRVAPTQADREYRR